MRNMSNRTRALWACWAAFSILSNSLVYPSAAGVSSLSSSPFLAEDGNRHALSESPSTTERLSATPPLFGLDEGISSNQSNTFAISDMKQVNDSHLQEAASSIKDDTADTDADTDVGGVSGEIDRSEVDRGVNADEGDGNANANEGDKNINADEGVGVVNASEGDVSDGDRDANADGEVNAGEDRDVNTIEGDRNVDAHEGEGYIDEEIVVEDTLDVTAAKAYSSSLSTDSDTSLSPLSTSPLIDNSSAIHLTTPPSAPRHLDSSITTVVTEDDVLLSEHVYPKTMSSRRRLQFLASLSHLTNPLSSISNIFGSSLSPRDRDQLDIFARRVATSRERVYRDLMFATGAKSQGLDEFAMKQLVAKVGLENLAKGYIPSSTSSSPLSLSPSLSLSPQETQVLEAARRSRLQIDRITSAYQREVNQHAKTLRQSLSSAITPSIQSQVNSIASTGLFKSSRDMIHLRRLRGIDATSHPLSRRLAATLLPKDNILTNAGSILLNSLDPSHLAPTIRSTLQNIPLLYLPNIHSLSLLREHATSDLPSADSNDVLQQILSSIFPPQQAAVFAGPLRSFQRGVSAATDTSIQSFLDRERLSAFLSVDAAKQLLSNILGGAYTPSISDAAGWKALGLPDASLDSLASLMPFDTFLAKMMGLAQEIDQDVGVIKRETKDIIGEKGIHLLPQQLTQVDRLLDDIVWGALRPPPRRLQQTETETVETDTEAETDTAMQQRHTNDKLMLQGTEMQQQQMQQQMQVQQQQQAAAGTSDAPAGDVQKKETQKELQYDAEAAAVDAVAAAGTGEVRQRQPAAAGAAAGEVQEVQQPAGSPESAASGEEQAISKDTEVDGLGGLLDVLLDREDARVELEPEEEMQGALQRVDLLADAITVLLKEYQRAVEDLQDLLEEQLETADEIKEELEDQVKHLRKQVSNKQQQKQQGAATAAAEVAKAYDEAMEGLRGSLEHLLQEQMQVQKQQQEQQEQVQQEQPLSAAVQQQVAALAAKIEAAAEEHHLPPLLGPAAAVAAH